ncbi:MAG: glycosyltransferase family 2 protein [Thermanaerothrix sp.]|uniref:glycosyltransferase family 2 protein n=1 Tax=Thermanaerothrix sp. TaxID=2972675 RepID=UPI003C7DCDA4
MEHLVNFIDPELRKWLRKYVVPRGSMQDRFLRWVIGIILPQTKYIFRYSRWIKKHEPNKKELLDQAKESNKFKYKPLISIVMPVFNPPPRILEQAIKSVLNQSYFNWELCIADASVGNEIIRKLLRNYAQVESRIKLIELEQNLGIAGNTNAAIQISRGDYIGFLDHDDELAPFALYEVVSQLQTDQGTKVFFSDEDKLTPNGKRHSPFFKPGFSPDLLRSVNYACHFLVVERELGNEVGWLRDGFDGAQDFDLILRLMEKTDKFTRIPKILYHWREIPGSAAYRLSEKPFASISGKKALQEHLERTGRSARVEDAILPTFYRIVYEIKHKPQISIIIPNQDHSSELTRCVWSILKKSTYSNFEIIIIENNSKEKETFSLYEKLQRRSNKIRVIEWQAPFNYHTVNNWATQYAQGEVLLFLNNDTEVITPDWLEQMLMHTIRDEIGVVGAKLYYPNYTIQHAGVVLGLGGVAGHVFRYYSDSLHSASMYLKLVRNVMANTGACMMIRRATFEKVGGFDENYKLSFGDVDLCLKVFEAGYLNLWTPYAELYHHESKTRGHEDSPDKIERFEAEKNYFRKKWAHWLEKGDPYYNPNLSLEYEDFRIKL